MIDLKNTLLIAIVLGILTLVGLYIPYAQYNEQESAPVTTDGEVERVVYTNRGFEPDMVTVDVGTTVEWVNGSDKLMWVASDDHPSHQDLPGFDQKGSEGNARPSQSFLPVVYAHAGVEIYRYTFLKSGTWEYHNHLVPIDRGMVVVK